MVVQLRTQHFTDGQSHSQVGVSAGVATGSAAGFNATGLLRVNAGLASVTGLANNAGISIPTGFPDSSNTGYLNDPGYPGSLTAPPGSITSGSTYSYRDFNGGLFVGSLGSPVSNVTFQGCLFRGVAVEDVLVALFGDNITFNYCTFKPQVSAPPVSYAQSYQYGIVADGPYGSFVQQLTVRYCDIWGFGNAIDINGSTQAKPQVFEHNYIHDAADDGGSYHTDGIGSLSGSGSGSYVIINHNTIEAIGNTNGIAFQQGVYDHYTITNNLFGGFGYTIAVWAGSSFIIFEDNTFSTWLPVVFGPLYTDAWVSSSSPTFGSWRRNIWHVPSGAAWGTPGNDGKFWMPVGGSSPSNDNPFVSTTDYTG